LIIKQGGIGVKEHKNRVARRRAAGFFAAAALMGLAAFAIAVATSLASRVEASDGISRFRGGGMVSLMMRVPDKSGDIVASRDIGK
jgi:hypothetical protein